MGVHGMNPSFYGRSGTPNNIARVAHVAIGASGAATLTGANTGMTCVKNTTGTYDVTFPIAPASGYPLLTAGIQKSASPTVALARLSAINYSAGTATLITYLATPGTPVEPASGDTLWIKFEAGA